MTSLSLRHNILGWSNNFIIVLYSVCVSLPLTFVVWCTGVLCSLLTEADAGHTEFIDEVFQNETRFPGGEWKPAAEAYTDVVQYMVFTQTHTDYVFTIGHSKPWQQVFKCV